MGRGLFSAPNTASMMSAVPAAERGAASGMRSTFQNAGFSLSIGVFFSLLIVGLQGQLPGALYRGLTGQGVPAALARHVAGLPPVSTIFAAFLGYNPIQAMLEPTGALARLPASRAGLLTGKEFFPHLIAGAFHQGLVVVFIAATVMAVLAAGVSLLRGGRPVYAEPSGPGEEQPGIDDAADEGQHAGPRGPVQPVVARELQASRDQGEDDDD